MKSLKPLSKARKIWLISQSNTSNWWHILEEPKVENIILCSPPYSEFPEVKEKVEGEGWEKENYWYVVVSARDIWGNTVRTHFVIKEDGKRLGIRASGLAPHQGVINIFFAVILSLGGFTYFFKKEARKNVQVLNKIHPIHFIISMFLMMATLDMLVHLWRFPDYIFMSILLFTVTYAILCVWKVWNKPWQRVAFIVPIILFFGFFGISEPYESEGPRYIEHGESSLILPHTLILDFDMPPFFLMLITKSRKQRIALNLAWLIAFLVIYLFYFHPLYPERSFL